MIGAGYQVNTATVRAASTRLFDCGADLGAIRDRIGAVDVPTRAFGPSGQRIAAAVGAAMGRRLAGLSARREAMCDFAGRLGDSADEYDRAEATAAAELDTVPDPSSAVAIGHGATGDGAPSRISAVLDADGPDRPGAVR